jgi:hypothetical protein
VTSHGAARLWIRCDWRQRWLSLVALAVLTGLASAVVMTATAGARRTASSLDRLIAETRPYDDFVVVASAAPGDPVYSPALIRRLQHLPVAAVSTTVSMYPAAPVGHPDLQVTLIGPEDGRTGSAIARDLVIRGRGAIQSRRDEVTVNQPLAQQLHLHPGSTLQLQPMSPQWSGGSGPGSGPAKPLRLRVVGIQRGVSEVEGTGGLTVIGTRSFQESYARSVRPFARMVMLRRRAGTSDAEFDHELHRLLPRPALGSTHAVDETRATRKTVSVLTDGLLLFALIAGGAAVFAISQAVGRHVAVGRGEQPVLSSLGLTRRGRVAALVESTMPIAVGGAGIALITSYAVSGLMPIGLARRIEPTPGLHFDPFVATLGGALVIGLVIVASAVSAWSVTRRDDFAGAHSPSILTSRVAAAGAGPVVTTGTRLALERTPPRLPVRSALVGVCLAMVGAIAALTFSASLQRLGASPTRWGYDWDLNVPTTGTAAGAAAARRVAHVRGVDAVALLSDSFSTFGRHGTEGVQAFGLSPVSGSTGYTLRSGVQPVGPDEMVVGRSVIHEYHLEVGDTLLVDKHGGQGRVRIVGVAILPALDNGTLGGGFGFSRSGFSKYAGNADVTTRIAVRARPHTSPSTLARGVSRALGTPVGLESRPTRPGDVENLVSVRRLPLGLATFIAMLGIAALTHVLVTTVRRRRGELSTLRSIGMTPRGASRCIVWQSLVIIGIGTCVGVPLGLAVGSMVWRAVARGTGVATDALRPTVSVVAVVAVGLAVALALGMLVGRRAAHLQLAAELRRE